MIERIVLLLLCFCFSQLFTCSAAAQSIFSKKSSVSKVPQERRMSFLVGGGLAAVDNDICGSPECNNFGLNVNFGALYRISTYLNVSGQLDYVRLGATQPNTRLVSSYSFQSDVIGASGSIVVNLLDTYAGAGGYRSLRRRLVVPYVKAGAGLVYYTPTSYPGEGKLKDSQTTFDPLRKYPAIAAVIPFGGGLSFHINEEFSIATEFIYYITTTDHLDNIVPMLGNSRNDYYGTAAIKLVYTPELQNKIFSRK